MFCELRQITLIILTTVFVTILSAQDNLLLNGDFEIIRQANIDLVVKQPSKTQTITLDDSSLLKTKYPGTDDYQVMSMHWNYLEDSLSKGSFEMYNALYSESENAQNGNVYSKFTVMHLDYLPNESSVQSLAGRLKSSLKKGHLYKVKFHLKFLRGNHFSKSICIGFTKDKTPYGIGIKKESKKPIYRHNIQPVWCTPDIVTDTNNYREFEFQYTANGNENYIYIGNLLYEETNYWQEDNWDIEFKPTQNLQELKKKKRIQIQESLLSVYAIDNISIVLSLEEEMISKQELKTSFDTTHVKTFHFALGKAQANIDLSSIIEKVYLDNIEQILVIGHTDNTGDGELNQTLSYQRALFVSNEIKEHIDIEISYTGKSYHLPVSENIHSKNRRVEVYFIRKLKRN